MLEIGVLVTSFAPTQLCDEQVKSDKHKYIFIYSTAPLLGAKVLAGNLLLLCSSSPKSSSPSSPTPKCKADELEPNISSAVSRILARLFNAKFAKSSAVAVARLINDSLGGGLVGKVGAH